jgi:hypothetical protein
VSSSFRVAECDQALQHHGEIDVGDGSCAEEVVRVRPSSKERAVVLVASTGALRHDERRALGADRHEIAAHPGARPKNNVKVYLTDDQVLRLLCIGERCNLGIVRSIQLMETHMNNEILAVRVAQALLAVGVTTASVLVFQFAMLVG